MDSNLDTLLTLCQQLGVPVPPPPPEPPVEPAPPPTLYQPVPGIDCWHCHFRALPLQPGSVDAVVTDIPWKDDWLRRVPEFAEWCAKVLKPGGIMVTLYTAYNLDRLFAMLGEHLDYVWTCVSPMHGCVLSRKPFVTRCCTLCVVYSKGSPASIHRSPQDLLPFSWREETRWHEHQQSLPVVQYLVEHFAAEGDLIADPCSGGWTTMEACWRTGRRFVGSDDRPNCLDVARDRFAAMRASVSNPYGNPG
jgi:hypothetical protein